MNGDGPAVGSFCVRREVEGPAWGVCRGKDGRVGGNIDDVPADNDSAPGTERTIGVNGLIGDGSPGRVGAGGW